MKTKRIIIADDHQVVRVGCKFILEEEFGDVFIDYAGNYAETKEKIIKDKFDLIILDINMPGSIFKAMVKELKELQKNLKILIFSTFEKDVAIQYIEEGADGFLNKQCKDNELIKAVRSIFENGYFYTHDIINLLTRKDKKEIFEILSPREFQVFELLAKGNGNIEIANILAIETPTVGTYKRRVYEKLKIKNIIELAKIYNSLH